MWLVFPIFVHEFRNTYYVVAILYSFFFIVLLVQIPCLCEDGGMCVLSKYNQTSCIPSKYIHVYINSIIQPKISLFFTFSLTVTTKLPLPTYGIY